MSISVDELRQSGVTPDEWERTRADVIREQARRSGSRSLAAFVKQAWHIFETAPLKWNWHHGAICLHLEALARSEIRRLRLHQPPRSGKSSIFAICFPAWVWTFRPNAQFIYLSHSADLSVEHSIKCRMVIESDWYRATHMRGWSISADQNVKADFLNTAGGRRIAGSTKTGVIGRGGDFVMFDDPLSESAAHSQSEIEHVNRIVANTISTRLNDPRTGAVALNMQRLAINDPSTMLPDAEVLSLPLEAVPARRSRTYHYVGSPPERVMLWEDPRETPGELLWPERWSTEEIERLKRPPFGVNAYMAQYGQEPRSFEGGMFKRGDWRFYQAHGEFGPTTGSRPDGCFTGPASPHPGAFSVKVLTMDCAFKDNPSGSRVAIHVWGRAGVKRYLLYRHTAHMDFGTSRAALRMAYQRHPDCHRYLVEEAANGAAIISELKAEIAKLIGVPARGGKGQRAAAAQPYQQANDCFLPDGADGNEDFVSSTASFDAATGKNSDDVDTFSMAMVNMDEEPEGEIGSVAWNRR